jgi:hypothetical protein
MKRIMTLVLSILLAFGAGFVPAEALKVREPEPTVYLPQRACLSEEAVLKKVAQRHLKLHALIQSCTGAENVEDCLVVRLRARDEARKKNLTNLIILGSIRERLPELKYIIGLKAAEAASSNDEENAGNLIEVRDLSENAVKSFDKTIGYINKMLNDE